MKIKRFFIYILSEIPPCCGALFRSHVCIIYCMSDTDSFTASIDKDILRQREIEAQLAALRSPAPNARAAAVRRLGDMQVEVGALLDMLHDPVESVRAAAAMALGNFIADPAAPDVIESLLAAIDDSSERVCQSAIRSLGMLRAQNARGEIESFLDDSNPYILGAAILSLARLGADDLAEQLAGFIHHESPYVQMQAARASGILGYAPVGPEIIRLLEKTRASRQASGFVDPAASRDRRENDLYNLQNQLVRVCGELRLSDAAPLLVDTAQKDIGFRGLAVEALIAIGAEIDPDLLARLLSDPGVYLRKRLLMLFAQYNYQPALPLLRPLLNDENFMIRVAALQALTQMRDAEALPRIHFVCLHDSNPFIRVQAVQSLVEIQGQEAMPVLLALADDVNFQVRRSAVTYLLEWKAPVDKALHSLARFYLDYPDDPFAAPIKEVLDARGFDPVQAKKPVEVPTPLLPAALEKDRSLLIDTLERWHAAIDEPSTPDRLAAQSAIGYLLDVLRRSE